MKLLTPWATDMKLINTFRTNSGHVGRQWMLNRDPARTVTVWCDRKQVRASAMKDADLKTWGDEAKRRYVSLQGGHK